MAEDKATKLIHLTVDEDVYQRVRHAAVDERTNASVWIRDAIARKLDGVPEEPELASLCGAWASMTDDGRALLSKLAGSLALVPGYRRPPEE